MQASARKVLRILAILVALGGLGYWLAAGSNTGWTKNRVEKRTLDEVTGIDAVTFEDRFVPGVDLLVGTLGAAAVVFGISFFIRKDEKAKFEIGRND